MNLFELARQLIDIESISGGEKAIALYLKAYLSQRGFNVRLQEAQPQRFNLLAQVGTPRLLFSTHLDTVPPFIPSSEDEQNIYGRGACDTKGIIAAQITAAEQLIGEGRRDLGLLLVVGEERESSGAQAANQLDLASEFLINGEPTENKLVLATKGTLCLEIETRGRAAHSAYPQLGESAIEKLLDVLLDVRRLELPRHQLLGETHYNIGLISGGVAPNVIPEKAQAVVHFRLVEESANLEAQLEKLVEQRAVMKRLSGGPPVFLNDVEGFETTVVSFMTDIPLLTNLGKPYLLGPGSILDAHTAQEKVAKRELTEAVALYCRLAKSLLTSH